MCGCVGVGGWVWELRRGVAAAKRCQNSGTNCNQEAHSPMHLNNICPGIPVSTTLVVESAYWTPFSEGYVSIASVELHWRMSETTGQPAWNSQMISSSEISCLVWQPQNPDRYINNSQTFGLSKPTRNFRSWNHLEISRIFHHKLYWDLMSCCGNWCSTVL